MCYIPMCFAVKLREQRHESVKPTCYCAEGSSRRRKYRDIDNIDGDDVVYDDEEDEDDFLPEESPQPTRRQVLNLPGICFGCRPPELLGYIAAVRFSPSVFPGRHM